MVSCDQLAKHPATNGTAQAAAAKADTALVADKPSPVPLRQEVALEDDGGTYRVPVLINGAIRLSFTIDSGATDVTIPADVAMTLARTGTIGRADFIGNQTFVLADGSTMPSPEFRIRSLRVGSLELRNVTASVTGPNGSLLLGQTFLSRVSSWSIDNQRHMLVLVGLQGTDEPPSSATSAMTAGSIPNPVSQTLPAVGYFNVYSSTSANDPTSPAKANTVQQRLASCGVGARVDRSDTYPRFRPGLIVVLDGPFAGRPAADEDLALARSCGVGGYTKLSQ